MNHASPSSHLTRVASTSCDRYIDDLIGRTPLIALTLRYRDKKIRVLAKAEHYNLTGSIKDRVALYILRQALRSGALRSGDTIVEASSGNSGIAFAAIGRAFGCNPKIYMPEGVSIERKQLLMSLGAQLELISEADGGFREALRRCDAFACKGDRVFSPDQFANELNCEAHQETTGAEILAQLTQLKVRPDAFVAGVGTGGTIMGVGRALRSAYPTIQVCAMELAESPTLSMGYKTGRHRIQGLFDEFVPGILKLDEVDDIVQIHDGDAILMAQRLSAELGLSVGMSSGANLVAAIKVAATLPEGATVLTVFCDDSKKYLSTDLFKTEPVRADYIAPRVEFSAIQSFGYTDQTRFPDQQTREDAVIA